MELREKCRGWRCEFFTKNPLRQRRPEKGPEGVVVESAEALAHLFGQRLAKDVSGARQGRPLSPVEVEATAPPDSLGSYDQFGGPGLSVGEKAPDRHRHRRSLRPLGSPGAEMVELQVGLPVGLKIPEPHLEGGQGKKVCTDHGQLLHGQTRSVRRRLGGEALAQEGARAGITVNAICPGYVWTPLVARQVADQARLHGLTEDEVIRQVILAPQPTKQFVQPEEIAEMAAYLCSDWARSITGSTISIDGGWTAK